MITCSTHSNTPSGNTYFETTWNSVYPTLRSLTTRLVYSFHVPSWHGQEDDIVEDVLQETARRILERIQKAERGEAPPIHMIERMIIATAYNCCRDIRRHDYRLIRMSVGVYPPEAYEGKNDQDGKDLSEIATEHVYQEMLFTLLAQEIIKFPPKQRRVLLTDLANRMCFEAQPTSLQRAFLNAGIRLEEYQQPLAENAGERNRTAALLHYAYKRISHLVCVQQHALVA